MTESRFVSKTPTVHIHLPDGRTIEGERGASVARLLGPILAESKAPIVGAVINGELHELTHPITLEARVRPVTMAEADGARIYRRSLTFLLETAFTRLFPQASLHIDHSLVFGGYFCTVGGRSALTSEELQTLVASMRELVKQDLPFEQTEVPRAEAIACFEKQHYADKVSLMRHRSKASVNLYRIGDYVDYHQGYMVPSTGYLKWFELSPMDGGFALHYPRQHQPSKVDPVTGNSKLLEAFRQYGAWLQRLGISSVGALDDAIEKGRSKEIVLISEALHEQTVAEIARQIANRGPQARLVLISGPSSSGKTTFSRRLAVQLLALGLSPYALELDNYFLSHDKTPRDANGDFDFETIEALDLPLLSEHLQRLLAGEQVQLPRYSFQEGRPHPGETVQLRPNQLIILEGIHGLNPRLIPASLASQSFKVYASALTQLNLDRHNRVSTTDTRLIRRIVRDARDRGYTASQTIARWESVRRGEKLHIFPHQENADALFNSALVYELSALRPLAEPLLRQVAHGTPEYVESRRLLAFLDWFSPLQHNDIPNNSILREFIGGSSLADFKVWSGV